MVSDENVFIFSIHFFLVFDFFKTADPVWISEFIPGGSGKVGQNTQTQNIQAQNTQGQNTQSPKIPKIEIAMLIK